MAVYYEDPKNFGIWPIPSIYIGNNPKYMAVNGYVLVMQKIATFYQTLAHVRSWFESKKVWPLTIAH